MDTVDMTLSGQVPSSGVVTQSGQVPASGGDTNSGNGNGKSILNDTRTQILNSFPALQER